MENESVKAAIAGAGAGLVTDLIFYSLDSYKTQLQAKSASVDLRKLFRGFLPLTLGGTVPSFGIFFGVYYPTKASLLEYDIQPPLAVLISSITAGVPASFAAVPADVLKKQIILGRSSSLQDAAMKVMRKHNGIRGLFIGWEANQLKDVPFAALKLSAFEAMVHQYEAGMGRGASSIETSALGVASGITTAILTCPLDVINTRIKDLNASTPYTSLAGSVQTIVAREGYISLFKGLLPRMVILGAGSGVFWGVYAQINSMLAVRP